MPVKLVYEFEGQKFDGSPTIAVRAAQEYLGKVKGHQMTMILVEKDEKQRASLERERKRVRPYGEGLQVYVASEEVKWDRDRFGHRQTGVRSYQRGGLGRGSHAAPEATS